MIATLTPWEATRHRHRSPGRAMLRAVFRLPVLAFWLAVAGVLVVFGQWGELHRLKRPADPRR